MTEATTLAVMKPILEAKNVAKAYGSVQALQGVDIELAVDQRINNFFECDNRTVGDDGKEC